MAIYVALKNNLCLTVDDKDVVLLNQHRWYINSSGYLVTFQSTGEARGDGRGGKTRTLFFHRMKTNAPKDKEVDHENRIKLDNRDSNLRFATRAENAWNIGITKRNSSGYIGVRYVNKGKGFKHWMASIRVNGKDINITPRLHKIEALMDRLLLEEGHFGKFAPSLSRNLYGQQ